MPELIDPINYELLDGITQKAKGLGYDVLLFSGILNSQQELDYSDYVKCMENIYELLSVADVDGILFAADWFYNPQTKEHIYRQLAMTEVPVVVMGEQHPDFPCVFMKQRSAMRSLTEHLITEHGFRDFYFLAGFEGHRDSEERLRGFRDALEAYEIPFSENDVFYGNFWIEEPKKIAAKIADGLLRTPQVVVCANDTMATALIDALMTRGLRVPEDIAVTGFDGRWETYYTTTQRITTVSGSFYRFGADAVNRLHQMLGHTVTSNACYQRIRYGSTCGCDMYAHTEERSKDRYLEQHIAKRLQRTMHQKRYIATNYINRLADAADLDDLVRKIDGLGYILPDWNTMDFCLCTDWLSDFSAPEKYRRSGFTDKMYLALAKRYHLHPESGYDFATGDILPALHEPHTPQLWVLTSLCADDHVFGYTVVSYANANDVCLDEVFVSWLDAISNGLRGLQRKMLREYQQQQQALQSIHDPATGLYNQKGYYESLPVFLKEHGCNQSMLVLIFAQQTQEQDVVGSVAPSQMIANALRLSASKQELYARMYENAFTVLIPLEEGADNRGIAQKRVLALEKKMQYMQGNVAGMKIPDLVCDSCIVEGTAEEIAAATEERLLKLMQKAAAASESSLDNREQLRRLRRDIYLNPQFDWSIATITKRVGISRSHFQRMYKEEFSVSCNDDIIKARIEKAQQLLAGTGMRIVEIATECGYSNEAHFMRQFKTRMGITATQYRKNFGRGGGATA